MRLSQTALAGLPATVDRPAYDRAAQAIGIVHLGIGAFHRAHQAWYTDRAMDEGDRDWAIAGVSLRSPEVAAQMNPQDGLFTVVEKSAAGVSLRVVGAVREILVAQRDRTALAQRMAAPTTRIVSLTVTEKGYCRAADGSLDFVRADEGSIYPLLAGALRQRRDAGFAGLTLLSCDNLADNGGQLARLMGEWLDRIDPALRGWFEAECTCPATMVDRIVPATTDADRAALAQKLGLNDEAAVVTERFSQWVIEDRFAAGRPHWDRVGAQLVSNVVPYETAKLRMLNGAHSLLAYVGLARGHTFVDEAIADPVINPLVNRLMREEAAPTISAAPGQDLDAYADALLARFANPALNHRLIQIAMDGSQKIPQRWLETLAINQRRSRTSPAILAGIAGWIEHLRGPDVNDPQAEKLKSAAVSQNTLNSLFGTRGLLPSGWVPSQVDARIVNS